MTQYSFSLQTGPVSPFAAAPMYPCCAFGFGAVDRGLAARLVYATAMACLFATHAICG